jgi:hypothetical protein
LEKHCYISWEKGQNWTVCEKFGTKTPFRNHRAGSPNTNIWGGGKSATTYNRMCNI